MKRVISKIYYAGDGVRDGILDVSMIGVVTRWCACDDRKNGGDSGTVDVDVSIAYSSAVS